MDNRFRLQIITPDKLFYDGDVEMVELTTTEGQIGIYAKHIPLTAIVKPGVLRIHETGSLKQAALLAGFIQVLPEQVTIMAEVAEWPDEIDANRAAEAKIRAERRLQKSMGEVDIARAEAALERALVRLEVGK